ncbi:hypothetical protein JW992_03745 [candidate division KSB1 bacterium]|nr:hypothetical protein [candidate division KSB1 bacterium]
MATACFFESEEMSFICFGMSTGDKVDIFSGEMQSVFAAPIALFEKALIRFDEHTEFVSKHRIRDNQSLVSNTGTPLY